MAHNIQMEKRKCNKMKHSILKILFFVIIITLVYSFTLSKFNSTKKQLAFDELTHYCIPTIGEEDVYDLMDKSNKSSKDQLLLKAITQEDTSIFADFSFLDSLVIIGFEKKTLSLIQMQNIHTIFMQEKDEGFDMCMPIYRDILVFKKHNKIKGLAKIAFWCGIVHFIGTNVYPENYGWLIDMNKLYLELH